MRIVLLWLVFLITFNGAAQGLKVHNKSIVDKNGKEVILRGIGLGGWMLQEPYMLQLSGAASTQQAIKSKIRELIGDDRTEQFYTAWLQNHCTRGDIDSLAAWGFNSVRLPMHFNLFTLPADEEPVKGQNTWLPTGFALTDSLLRWCASNKIYLILDLHAAPGGQGNDIAIADRDSTKPFLWQTDNFNKTIALWEKLAARYVNEEWLGAYDLVNEPNFGFQNAADKNGCAENENAPLKQLYVNLTKAIRKVDRKHMIIVEGNCWGNNYNGIFPLWDNNLVVSFHKYWNFTDQASIQKFLDIREKYNVPVWCGETGENSNVWFTDAVELFESNKIGWAMWPLKKMGINNMLQVKTNTGYQKLVDYWRGKGGKPSANEAYQSLVQLASDAHVSKNLVHKDVIDALIRQVSTTKVVPSKKHLLQPSAIIFAVDYDLGRNGYAYADKDTGNYWVSTTKRTDWNKGRMYRNDGVDINECKDSLSNGYAVSSIEDGEWLQYTVMNEKEGSFNINIRSSAKSDTGKLQLLVNGKIVADRLLPDTKNDQVWQTSTLKNIRFRKGFNTIRVVALKGGFQLNYLQFVSTTSRAKE